MKTSLIKRVQEKNLNDSEKQIEILFESGFNGESKQGTIILSGEGSLKVLLPV